MRLDERLRAVADLVPAGARLADIGTDHAYLPCALLLEGKIASAIACDKNPGPCAAARRTIRAADLSARVEVRLGDGLSPLSPGEADVVSISGMGGALMQEILAAAPEILADVSALVLQPQGAEAALRGWLYDAGFHIEAEALALADGRLYTALRARRGRREKPAPVLLAIGPCLWADKGPLLKRHIEALLFACRRRVAGMERSEAARGSAAFAAAKRRMQELEAHLTW